jgi:hypothetical protein
LAVRIGCILYALKQPIYNVHTLYKRFLVVLDRRSFPFTFFLLDPHQILNISFLFSQLTTSNEHPLFALATTARPTRFASPWTASPVAPRVFLRTTIQASRQAADPDLLNRLTGLENGEEA